MSLSKNQLKHLRGLCHDLKPVVMVGQKGITEALLEELDIAVTHHELVKIKIGIDDRDMRRQIADEICEKAEAENVQVIGKMLSIFRRNTKKPVVELPKK